MDEQTNVHRGLPRLARLLGTMMKFRFDGFLVLKGTNGVLIGSKYQKAAI
jgi:hypothetical protein